MNEEIENGLEAAQQIYDAAEVMLDGSASEEEERLVADYVLDAANYVSDAGVWRLGPSGPELIEEIAARVFNRGGSEMDKAIVAAYALADVGRFIGQTWYSLLGANAGQAVIDPLPPKPEPR